MMIRLGLTGGIGSGKTTAAKVFENIGIPVFYADDEAKKFLNNDNVKIELRNLFGNDILDSENNIIKAELAKIVFADSAQLEKLNSLIHPLLLGEFDLWSSKMKAFNHPLVVMEAAILLEANFVSRVDKVLTITANVEDRINRVMARDSVQREQVIARMNHQWSDDKRVEKSDFVIDNSDNKMMLKEIIQLIEKIRTEDSKY